MSRPRVLVIDAGLGNIGSVMAALKRHECTIERACNPNPNYTKSEFTHAVLPGVGSFLAGMEALESTGWAAWIKRSWCLDDRPLLGICLGMQLLASEGTEGGINSCALPGLDLIPGRVEHLAVNPGIALQHVGWNALHWNDRENALARALPDSGDMYFVHRYVFRPQDPAHSLAESEYGQKFTAVVGRGSLYGVQFHPEKSQRLGKLLIANFLNL